MSARLSRRGLIRLRDELSERDRQIILSVAAQRFLTGKQIQRLHFFEHATEETGARVARTVLARLTRQRVLARLERRVGGIRAGSASYVYRLGPVGRRLAGLDAGRHVREPSAAFLDHTLAVAQAHLAIVEAAREADWALLAVEVEPRCWRRYSNVGGGMETLRPDLYLVTANDRYEYSWFVEIDRATEFKPALARKCRQYETYYRTGREQTATGTFPRIVWVAPDEQRAAVIERVIRSVRGLDVALFRVTPQAGFVTAVTGGLA